VQETDADATVRGVLNARLTLEAGFTTVRDLLAYGDSIFAIRNGIDRGDIPGPRIIAAGKAISITGGHADESNGYRQDLFPDEGIERGVADGPAACAAAVPIPGEAGRGCDQADRDGRGAIGFNGRPRAALLDQELATIVATAHSLGRKAAAHAHGVDGINAALRAGVDSVEHATYLNDESIKLFKEKGAYYVPTLLAAKTVADNAKIPGFYLAVVARKGGSGRPDGDRGFPQGARRGCENRLRDGHRRVGPRPERARVCPNGSGRDDAGRGDQGGDRERGGPAGSLGPDRHD
jgi:imidazolonepropionase-like amidohydrolase